MLTKSGDNFCNDRPCCGSPRGGGPGTHLGKRPIRDSFNVYDIAWCPQNIPIAYLCDARCDAR